MKNTRLIGHGLRNEGAAFVKLDDGRWRRVDSSRRAGFGLCECGAHSEWLDSDSARKRWHRFVHKPAAREQEEQDHA